MKGTLGRVAWHRLVGPLATAPLSVQELTSLKGHT
jgi:hypothetical protein